VENDFFNSIGSSRAFSKVRNSVAIGKPTYTSRTRSTARRALEPQGHHAFVNGYAEPEAKCLIWNLQHVVGLADGDAKLGGHPHQQQEVPAPRTLGLVAKAGIRPRAKPRRCGRSASTAGRSRLPRGSARATTTPQHCWCGSRHCLTLSSRASPATATFPTRLPRWTHMSAKPSTRSTR